MFEVFAFEARTLSWWFDQKDNIDLDPPYQRRAQLWNESDKQFLIDSILNGYDVPKLYIADFGFGAVRLRPSQRQYAVIDGKQRLEAIFDFFEDRLPLAAGFEWSPNPSLQLGGLVYRDLVQNHPKVASKFSNFNPSMMRVVTDDEAKINELFVRLNRSKPLTGAEIRNAMRGIVPKLIRLLGLHEFFTSNVRFSVKRKQDLNAAAKLLLIEFRGKPVGTQKPNIDRFVEEGMLAEASTKEFERAARRVAQVLDRMAKIFSPRDELLSSAGPLAVYYWFVRELDPSNDRMLRNFLLDFEARRDQNKANATAGKKPIDADLVAYDKLDRSTDNQGSIEGRFDILRRRLAKLQQ